MAANFHGNEIRIPKRTTSLRLKHNRTASSISDDLDTSVSESNGLKTVNTVAGAITNFFKWSASPLMSDNKARSFDSIDIASSHDVINTSVLQQSKNVMDKRRSTGALIGDSTRSPSKDNTSKESSPGPSGYQLEVKDQNASLPKRGSSPGITFTATSSTNGEVHDVATDDAPLRNAWSRRSLELDGEKRDKTNSMPDIGEKSFETSLNSILNKCSETSLDMTGDLKDKKGDRKKRSQPWYTMLNPTYKSRSEDFKRQFKEIPAEERLICDYSCAMQKEILVHGRMFVTQSWVCFYANIFRWETVVTIPMKEIQAITKEKTARVIPNALQVSTEKEKYFFTSFTARDKTFMMLFRLWQNTLLEQPMSTQELWHWVHSCYGDELGLTSSDDDYVPPPSLSEGKESLGKDTSLISKGDSSELLPSDLRNDADEEGDSTHADISLNDSTSANLLGHDRNADSTDYSDTTEDDVSEGEVVCTEHDHFTKLAHNEVYQMPLEKLFELMFTDCEFFRNFTEKARKYSDVVVTPWVDDPDANIGRLREVRYTIPLNAPFGPKSSNTVEKHMCFKQSQQGIMYLIDAECTPLGIPYADAFYVMNRYCLTRVSKESCRLRVTSEVKFRKSVWGVVKKTKSEMDKWLSEYLMNFKESNLTDDVQHFQKSKKQGTPKPKSNQEKAEAMSVTNWLNIRNNNRKATPVKAKTPTKRSAEKTPTKRSSDKTPTKRSAEKIPTKRSAEKTPTKRSAENITDAHSTRDTGRHVTPTKKIKGDQSEEISFLKEEIYKLKRRVKKLEDREKKAEEKDGCPTRDELSKMVALEWNPYAAAKTLLCSLFSQSEILMHSVSGKAPNSRVKAKPKFDSRKYSIFTDIIKEKFPTLHTKDITSKVLAVQKNLQRESAKMEKKHSVSSKYSASSEYSKHSVSSE